MPILCVGETEEERERGDTERKLRHQVQEGLDKVAAERLPEVVIAYEPIWAIGTGQVATPEQAQEASPFVRALVADRDKAAAEQVRVLYGGSCKPDNAAELLALPDVDGALVGGASLDPADLRGDRRGRAPRDGPGRLPRRPRRLGARARTGRATRSRSPTRRCSTTLWASHPHTTLTAKGEAVGLPAGQMGNSEVGHLNLGAGAIVPQDLARIDAAVRGRHARRQRGAARGARRRRAGAPDRARLRRRRALVRAST